MAKWVKSPAGMMAPPFKNSKRVLGHSSMSINILLHGLTGPIEGKKYAGLMVPMKSNGDEWIAADSKSDHPRGFDFFVSNDGKTWTRITKGTGKKALVEIQFPDVKAKFIKVQLTEKSNSYYWSIHEIEIFEKRH